MTDTTDAERRHEGPSYWISTSLDGLIEAERVVAGNGPGDDFDRQLLADLRREIARRQRCIEEAEHAG